MVATTIFLSLVLALLFTALIASVWPISIWATHLYANTWRGLSMEAARARIGTVKSVEEPWAEGQYSGHSIVAHYKLYRLRLMFSDDKVLCVSVEITDS